MKSGLNTDFWNPTVRIRTEYKAESHQMTQLTKLLSETDAFGCRGFGFVYRFTSLPWQPARSQNVVNGDTTVSSQRRLAIERTVYFVHTGDLMRRRPPALGLIEARFMTILQDPITLLIPTPSKQPAHLDLSVETPACLSALPPSTCPASNHQVTGSQKRKRLSLSFPIQQPISNTAAQQQLTYAPVTPDPTATLLNNSTLMSPTVQSMASPTPSNSFLVALAAQERRVLELKEELQRAETELSELKRQWTLREARRKRDDLRHVQQLQPLNTALAMVDGNEDENPSTARSNRERERRKALSVGAKPSHRTVIAGQKHTRALSLLSPERLNRPEFPAFPVTDDPHDDGSQKPDTTLVDLHLPEATLASRPGKVNVRSTSPTHPPPREALLRTGRQMAEDFKEGLLNFIDDIRQVTVGDETIHGKQPRHEQAHTDLELRESEDHPTRIRAAQPSNRRRSAMASNWGFFQVEDRVAPSGKAVLEGVGEGFWREHGVSEKVKPDLHQVSRGNQLKHAVQLHQLPEEITVWEEWDALETNEIVNT